MSLGRLTQLMRLCGAHGVGAAFAGAVLLAASAGSAAAPRSASVSPSRDGPIPGFSGGFGESSCTACHFDGELNEAPGSLVLAGVPERYQPGESYALTLTLTRSGIVVGGFQLTARFEHGGAQAGTLKAARADGRITVTPDRGIQYAHHLRPGTDLAARDTARWELVWTAPASGDSGAVLVHAAANAADGDDSQLGDRIYTTVRVSRPGG